MTEAKHSPLPICCVTGRIAGDQSACGDCDPCGAVDAVPETVKALLKERDEWAERYSHAMGQLDETCVETAQLVVALADTVRMLTAVHLSAGLGRKQLERVEKARATLQKARQE